MCKIYGFVDSPVVRATEEGNKKKMKLNTRLTWFIKTKIYGILFHPCRLATDSNSPSLTCLCSTDEALGNYGSKVLTA